MSSYRLSAIPAKPFFRLDIPEPAFLDFFAPREAGWVSTRTLPLRIGPKLLEWLFDCTIAPHNEDLAGRYEDALVSGSLCDALALFVERDEELQTPWILVDFEVDDANGVLFSIIKSHIMVGAEHFSGWFYRYKMRVIRRDKAQIFTFRITELELWHEDYCQGVRINCLTGGITDTSLSVVEKKTPLDMEVFIPLRGYRAKLPTIPQGMTLGWALEQLLVRELYNSGLGNFNVCPWVHTNLPPGSFAESKLDFAPTTGKLNLWLHPTPKEARDRFRSIGAFRTKLRFGGIMLAPAEHLQKTGAGGLVQMAGINRKTSKKTPELRLYTPDDVADLKEHLAVPTDKLPKASRLLNEYLAWYLHERAIHTDAARRTARVDKADTTSAPERNRWRFQPFAPFENQVEVHYRILPVTKEDHDSA